MIRNRLLKAGAVAMSLALGLTPVAAMAADSTLGTNNTATTNDLNNADIIDTSKTGSLTIYKYDITAAEAAGDYVEGTYVANGEADSRVEEAMADYGVEGVQFSYLRVGNVETHSINNGTESYIELVYEIPTELADIIGLTAGEAVDMTTANESQPCDNTGVYHYTSQQLVDAMSDFLEADNKAAKDDLEGYFYDYGTIDSTTDNGPVGNVVDMPLTDENGRTSVDGLELGLYLVVETEVPENITDTTDPWFVQLPFTNEDTNDEAEQDGGQYWLYDMTCYPKNQSGNPTLDKSVRNAYSNTTQTGDKNGTVNSGSSYVVSDSANASDSLVVYNDDTNAGNTADTSDEAYVANRGGYTTDGTTAGAGGAGYSYDFEYRDTTTASEGDVLDYILVSRIPHISSSATFLTEYTFEDTLSAGLTYNHDAKIAFYDNAADANANNTANAVMKWDLASGNYAQDYVDISVSDPNTGSSSSDGSTRMTVSFTEAGLEVLNGESSADVEVNGLSDYYMVVYYTVTVNSDASVVLGDEGNPNDVTLVWSRTSDGHYNVLEDRNYVYAYGIDLTKEFSDGAGDFSKVEFKLYNQTDAYYVIAREDSDGVYYVTGKTQSEDEGTTFIPNSTDGTLIINGLEGDVYQMTEVATDNGYSLLKDQIVIDIDPTDRDIIASVAGVTGMDADAVDQIVATYHGGIFDENGNLITAQEDELTGAAGNSPANEQPNGNEIGAIDMFVGEIQPASATVDNVAANMTDGNASVIMSILNSTGFTLPQTGGAGIYLVTIIGIIVVAGGCYLIMRNKNKAAR